MIPQFAKEFGYLPENPYFYDHLTAEEMLHYVGHLFRLTAEVRNTRVRTLLNQVKLGAERRFPLRKLSKGMLQRVGIAQSLMNDPELLFLDEPLSGLDPVGRREVRDLILRLKIQGKTIFLSTHILSDAEMICDRVAILYQGRLQDLGELDEILKGGSAATEIVLNNPPPTLVAELKSLARSRALTPSNRSSSNVRVGPGIGRSGWSRGSIRSNRLSVNFERPKWNLPRVAA